MRRTVLFTYTWMVTFLWYSCIGNFLQIRPIGSGSGTRQFLRVGGGFIFFSCLHPGNLTEPLKIGNLKRKLIFQPSFSGAMLNFGGVS